MAPLSVVVVAAAEAVVAAEVLRLVVAPQQVGEAVQDLVGAPSQENPGFQKPKRHSAIVKRPSERVGPSLKNPTLPAMCFSQLRHHLPSRNSAPNKVDQAALDLRAFSATP